MIKAVYGSCNGTDIIFEHTGADQWSVPVPGNDTKYIIDIYAEDDAGNISYVSKYIYYWDGSSFQAIFKPFEYQTEILSYKYTSLLMDCEYQTVLLPNTIDARGIRYE